ncbi:hypothetical protein AVEN_181154-1 [Araneus ventricosus]|uniref:Uncharacterized protein n=1 Tax=Araneus ventricosus TaxID=182803 RepID=A0A4Y2T9C3_ARAVE|nr:hypothetical protein AVEN_181154-1 [Araneus ventricosus]
MQSTRTRAKNDVIGSRRSEPIILSDFLPQFYQGRVCKYADGALMPVDDLQSDGNQQKCERMMPVDDLQSDGNQQKCERMMPVDDLQSDGNQQKCERTINESNELQILQLEVLSDGIHNARWCIQV